MTDYDTEENCAAHDSPCCEVCAYERGFAAGVKAAAAWIEGQVTAPHFSAQLRMILADGIRRVEGKECHWGHLHGTRVEAEECSGALPSALTPAPVEKEGA